VPGSKAGVTVLDRTGVTFQQCVMPAAPGFAAAIPGVAVGLPHVGTCAAAVYDGQAVSSDDVATDERFSPVWRQLNTDHGVRRIRSWPALDGDGRAVGSFFMGFSASEPMPWPEDAAAVGARLAGLAIERHLSRERDQMLIRESQHRLRNLFASVMSIASQTADSERDIGAYMAAFEGRVRTLAAAHDLLTADKPTDLAELVRAVVGPFGRADALDIAGAPFQLAAPSIVPFSLVLHELATNAAKYGALSRPEGKARISWKTYRDEAGRHRFKLKWQERGGPTVAPPRRRGTGTLLVTQAFEDIEGRARLDHHADGVFYKVDAPMTGRLGRPLDDQAAE
jgi:two-component sensor histidine kinase